MRSVIPVAFTECLLRPCWPEDRLCPFCGGGQQGLFHLLFSGEKGPSHSPPRETLVSQETSSLEALCKQRFEISTWPYQLHGQCQLRSSPRCPGSAAAGGEGVRPQRVGSGNRNKPNPTTPPYPPNLPHPCSGEAKQVAGRLRGTPPSLRLCTLPPHMRPLIQL